ncbi:MAG: threonine synthase, partial [Candidatus Sumerlaeia bacterium]|nr:threonine synthase [Candidatus Sumerlaeia bacterium]
MKVKQINLVCTNCGKYFDGAQVYYPRCDICNEPLSVEKIAHGKIREGNILKQTILDRYSDFFPFEEVNSSLSLKEGFTPLIETQELARKLGIKSLWFKNETQNPTWSFKDRGTFVGIQHAVASGFKRIGTVSTGNMAVSVAAYGARAGLKTFILVSANIPAEKILPIAIYNPVLIKVTGDYGELYFNSLKIGKEQNIYFLNSDVPFRVEGSKTIAFEICEQLEFKVPDYVIVPTSSGGNLRGILKGFEEFYLCGLIERIPRIVCAQAVGCAPIYNAFIKEAKTISRVE